MRAAVEPVTANRRRPQLVSLLRYALYFVLVACVTVAISLQQDSGPKEGNSAPDFALPLVNAPSLSLTLEALRGRPALVGVFAGWCPSCRKAAPMLAELYRSKSASGVRFLGVIVDESPEEARATVASWRIPYPVVRDDGRFARDYAIRYLPTFIAIDQAGQVRHVTSGVPGRRRLVQWLDSIESSPLSSGPAGAAVGEARVQRLVAVGVHRSVRSDSYPFSLSGFGYELPSP
jgi:cytochrome c biogenesis protein CcmG/thiol:disulfide interchange protein DsbE